MHRKMKEEERQHLKSKPSESTGGGADDERQFQQAPSRPVLQVPGPVPRCGTAYSLSLL